MILSMADNTYSVINNDHTINYFIPVFKIYIGFYRIISNQKLLGFEEKWTKTIL